MQSRPSRPARRVAATNASWTRSIPGPSSTFGATERLENGIADGATGSQPPSSGRTGPCPRHGGSVDALRPAWASWMPMGELPYSRTNVTTRFRASSLSSE